MQRIAMTPLAGIASGVERGLNAVNTMQDIQRKKQAIIMEDMKIKEAQAKEADLNRVTTKQILFDNLQMGENVRSSVEPFYKMFADADGNISKRNTFEMMKFLESNPMAKQKMLDGRYADVQEEYNASKLELDEATQSGNEKKIQQAKQKFGMASQKLSGITQSLTDEKGNRLRLIEKYGGAAEKFLNGEMTADEFMKSAQEAEFAKQKAKDEQAIEKVRTIEEIRADARTKRESGKDESGKLSGVESAKLKQAEKYEGEARKRLDALNENVPKLGSPERAGYEKKANALVDIIKQQMQIQENILNKESQTGRDKFGYVIGEVRQGYKYVGNDQWQKL